MVCLVVLPITLLVKRDIRVPICGRREPRQSYLVITPLECRHISWKAFVLSSQAYHLQVCFEVFTSSQI